MKILIYGSFLFSIALLAREEAVTQRLEDITMPSFGERVKEKGIRSKSFLETIKRDLAQSGLPKKYKERLDSLDQATFEKYRALLESVDFDLLTKIAQETAQKYKAQLLHPEDKKQFLEALKDAEQEMVQHYEAQATK